MILAIYPIFIIINFVNLIICEEDKPFKHVISLTPLLTCNGSAFNTEDLHYKPTGPGEFVFVGTVTFSKEIKAVSAVKLTTEHCKSKSETETCERAFAIEFRNICGLCLMKGQIWSTIFDKVTPPLKCPFNGTYTFNGGYIDGDVIAKFLPHVVGTYWKYTFNTFDENNNWYGCLKLGYTVERLRIRHRNPTE